MKLRRIIHRVGEAARHDEAYPSLSTKEIRRFDCRSPALVSGIQHRGKSIVYDELCATGGVTGIVGVE